MTDDTPLEGKIDTTLQKKNADDSDLSARDIMEISQQVLTALTENSKNQVDAQISLQLKSQQATLDHEFRLFQFFRPFVVVVLLALLLLAGYILVVNKDQTTALTVVGYAVTFAAGWITGRNKS